MKRILGMGSLLMLLLPLLAAESTAPAAPPASAAANTAAMQPAVNTSPTPDRNSTSSPTSNPAPAPATAPAAPAGPGTNGRPGAPAARTPGAAAATPRSRAQDRLELDTTQITGNRELPRVLYVVPWKRSDLGDLAGRPANSLLDEVLAPVDRDVFKRQNRYYDALKPDAAAGRSEGEK